MQPAKACPYKDITKQDTLCSDGFEIKPLPADRVLVLWVGELPSQLSYMGKPNPDLMTGFDRFSMQYFAVVTVAYR